MAFTLVKNSKYHIDISSIFDAEKQLGRKFYKFKVKSVYDPNRDFFGSFSALGQRTEEFATDYWSYGWQKIPDDAGYFFCFLNMEDAVTFKLIANGYFDGDDILLIKPLHNTRPRNKNNKKAYKPDSRTLATLRKLKTSLLWHFHCECLANDGKYDVNGITVYLDDINYVLKDRKIK